MLALSNLKLNDSASGLVTVKVTKAESIYQAEYRQTTDWDHGSRRDAAFMHEAFSVNSNGVCRRGGSHNLNKRYDYVLLHD